MGILIKLPKKYWTVRAKKISLPELITWWQETSKNETHVKKLIAILFVEQIYSLQDGRPTLDVLESMRVTCRDLYIIAIDVVILQGWHYEEYFQDLHPRYHYTYRSVSFSFRERDYFLRNGHYEQADGTVKIPAK